MTLSLFRNFLQYLRPSSHQPVLQSLLWTDQFLKLLHLSLLLSFLPGGSTVNEVLLFGKITTGS